MKGEMKKLAVVLLSEVESIPSSLADITRAYEGYRDAMKSPHKSRNESIVTGFKEHAAEIICAALLKYSDPSRFGLSHDVFPELSGIRGIRIPALSITNSGFLLCAEYGVDQIKMFEVSAIHGYRIEMF